MSEDPETKRQILHLVTDERPLLVVDVDEVVLEFVRPFMAFLETRGHILKTDSFRLTGNVINRENGEPAEDRAVKAFIEDFFSVQSDWQTPVVDAAEALRMLDTKAAIVMLTAMPHRHYQLRRSLLDSHGFPYPLVTTEAAKGPAIAEMRSRHDRPVAFIDDIPHNHLSVRKSVPDASLFHLMSYEPFKDVMPPLQHGIIGLDGWNSAHNKISRALNIA